MLSDMRGIGPLNGPPIDPLVALEALLRIHGKDLKEAPQPAYDTIIRAFARQGRDSQSDARADVERATLVLHDSPLPETVKIALIADLPALYARFRR